MRRARCTCSSVLITKYLAEVYGRHHGNKERRGQLSDPDRGEARLNNDYVKCASCASDMDIFGRAQWYSCRGVMERVRTERVPTGKSTNTISQNGKSANSKSTNRKSTNTLS